MGISQYMGFYTPGQIQGLFQAFSNRKIESAYEIATLDAKIVCDIFGKNTKFQKISFFKNPLDYLFDKTHERAYKQCIKDVIKNLNGQDEISKIATLDIFEIYRKNGIFIPEIIVKEMDKNTEWKESFYNKLKESDK